MADRDATHPERDDAAARAMLKHELKVLYDLMQTPAIEAATERGFNAASRELGLAAVEYARQSARDQS